MCSYLSPIKKIESSLVLELSLIVLEFTFKSMIHFELLFVECEILIKVLKNNDVQMFQHDYY